MMPYNPLALRPCFICGGLHHPYSIGADGTPRHPLVAEAVKAIPQEVRR